MFPGGVETDAHIAKPVRAEPIIMRTRFSGEGAVAALRHLVDVHFQPILALVTMQPEERAGELACFEWEFSEFLFELPDFHFTSRLRHQLAAC